MPQYFPISSNWLWQSTNEETYRYFDPEKDDVAGIYGLSYVHGLLHWDVKDQTQKEALGWALHISALPHYRITRLFPTKLATVFLETDIGTNDPCVIKVQIVYGFPDHTPPEFESFQGTYANTAITHIVYSLRGANVNKIPMEQHGRQTGQSGRKPLSNRNRKRGYEAPSHRGALRTGCSIPRVGTAETRGSL